MTPVPSWKDLLDSYKVDTNNGKPPKWFIYIQQEEVITTGVTYSLQHQIYNTKPCAFVVLLLQWYEWPTRGG